MSARTPRSNIRQLVNSYIEGRYRRHEIVHHTRVRLRTVLGTFADSYGDRDPAKLGLADVERWLETRGHLSANSRRADWSQVRVFVRWLADRGHIRRDPLVGVKAPRNYRAVPRALSAEECAAIEAVLPDARAWAMYSLMRWVGLRRAEVVSLNVADWDQRAGLLTFRGKGGHERIEPVPPWVAERLRTYLAETGSKAGPMICTLDGRRRLSSASVSRLMKDWMYEAGIKTAAFDGRGPHSLRHTIASELIESGADVRVVQELLGHSSLTSTEVYLRRATAGRVLDALTRAYG